jgi:hypothetical protein
MAAPDKIPIEYLPEFRSWCIGRYTQGQFLGSVIAAYAKDYDLRSYRSDWPDHQRWYSVLHLFDHDGSHRSSDIWYAGTGQGAPQERAFARLEEGVDALPGRTYGDIAIRLFRVEVDDVVFGLIDQSDELGFDCVVLQPNDWGFYPPWDGRYDT